MVKNFELALGAYCPNIYTVHGSPKAVFCYYLASIRKEFQAALYTVRVVTIEELIYFCTQTLYFEPPQLYVFYSAS